MCPAERHEPIAIPPARPAPGPSALHRATECSWIRSRPRPASPALANKSVPHGCNRAAVSLAPSESVPRGSRAVSPPRAVRWALQRPAHPTFTPSRATSDPAQRVSACQERPSNQRRGPSPRARPSALHRATASARVPIPTQARASATGGCGTGQHVGLGAERRSGGDQRLHSPTAWLPPGHEPGAGGVAQLPSSKRVWPLGPEDFWIDDATPWSRRSIGVTARRQARMRARAHTARTDQSRHARHDHGVHGSVTARTPRCTARTPRSRRARFGHGGRVNGQLRRQRWWGRPQWLG